MNKKIIMALIATVALSAYLATTVSLPATANAGLKSATLQTPTIAILDTALDTNVATIQGRIAHEVCILEWNSCPNGKNFMEGPGSVNLPYNIISKNGFDHGTQMVSVFTNNNKDVNVVFVRIIGATATGTRQIANESTFVNALDWVYKNKDRFNIQAVSMSQSHHNLMRAGDYCPKTTDTQNKIKDLVAAEIPVFLPTGNVRDYSRISWPACITDSISVGASTDYDQIPIWSNIDVSKTDFYALGITSAMSPGTQLKNVTGTSVSAQVAAAQWLAVKKMKPSLSYQQIYDLLANTSKTIYNPRKIAGKMINIQGALNG
jgi:hypothetical protein